MPERPAARLEIRDFQGMMTRTDPRDMTGMAERQVNLIQQKRGLLQPRLGLVELTVDEED
mgnify:CR=1 FL=1